MLLISSTPVLKTIIVLKLIKRSLNLKLLLKPLLPLDVKKVTCISLNYAFNCIESMKKDLKIKEMQEFFSKVNDRKVPFKTIEPPSARYCTEGGSCFLFVLIETCSFSTR